MSHYRKIKPEHVEAIAETLADAWQDPSMPKRQYETAVKSELQKFKEGKPNPPYDTFINLLKFIPAGPKTLLDVGASSGYYSEVLKIRGFHDEYQYTGLDYSTYYRDFAHELFNGINFEVGSALQLPFADKSFDVVLHGACLMHLAPRVNELKQIVLAGSKIERAIEEAVRVAKSYVLFHRTPIYLDETRTEAFLKTAYDIPCMECHFSEKEIVGLFYKHGLEQRATGDVFIDGNFAHRSYLLKVA